MGYFGSPSPPTPNPLRNIVVTAPGSASWRRPSRPSALRGCRRWSRSPPGPASPHMYFMFIDRVSLCTIIT